MIHGIIFHGLVEQQKRGGVRKEKKNSLKLVLSRGPFFVFALEFVLDPFDGNGGPDTCPEEWYDPADLS